MTTALARHEPADIEVSNGVARCSNLGQMLTHAQMMLQSGMLPPSFKTPQAVVVAIQYGAELKLSPMAALNAIAVIQGKPSLYGMAVPGVAEASGHLEDWNEWIEGEGDNAKAFCKVKRRGVASPMIGEFSAQDAKTAGLWKKAGPWTQYPKDMLRWKARARAFRPLFGDVLCGMNVAEDIQDAIIESKPRPEVSIVDPLQGSSDGPKLRGVAEIVRPTVDQGVTGSSPTNRVAPRSESPQHPASAPLEIVEEFIEASVRPDGTVVMTGKTACFECPADLLTAAGWKQGARKFAIDYVIDGQINRVLNIEAAQ